MSTGATRPIGKPAKIVNLVGINLNDVVRGTALPILGVALDDLAMKSLDTLTGMEAENTGLEARRHESENESESESESRGRVDVVIPVVNLAPLDMNATTLLETRLARETMLEGTLQTKSLARATAVHRPRISLTDRVMRLQTQSPEEEEEQAAAANVDETILLRRQTIDMRDAVVVVVVAVVAHLLALPVHVRVTT
jgi:hypothetical protein